MFRHVKFHQFSVQAARSGAVLNEEAFRFFLKRGSIRHTLGGKFVYLGDISCCSVFVFVKRQSPQRRFDFRRFASIDVVDEVLLAHTVPNCKSQSTLFIVLDAVVQSYYPDSILQLDITTRKSWVEMVASLRQTASTCVGLGVHVILLTMHHINTRARVNY